MRTLYLLVAFLGVTSLAHADVSDSGNLTIGGQGVIQGSMTVQGNAFSVGGSTFSVDGGSITLGGRLNLATAGIKFADGTVQTSSASGSVPATSSRSVLTANYDTTVTSWDNIVATIAIVLPGNSRLQVTGTNFSASNTSAYNGAGVGFKINGAYPDGLSSPAMSPEVSDYGGADQAKVANFVYTSTYAYAAGTYNIQLVLARYGSAGTARLACGTFGPCIFQAHTIP